MPERLNGTDSKSVVRASVPGVRIPPSPREAYSELITWALLWQLTLMLCEYYRHPDNFGYSLTLVCKRSNIFYF